jgi:pimeloyl-ACP methyl ester carboxylesterase
LNLAGEFHPADNHAVKTTGENKSSTGFHRLLRVLLSLVLIGGVLLLPIVGCQSKLIYFPRPYGPGVTADWFAKTHGRLVDFETSQGRQRAFLQGNLRSARNLWIVCGGNGTVALDWSEWIARHAPRDDAWLLVDFPGYGDCEGYPSPARIRESLRVAVPLASAALGWRATDPARLRFLGHSLGGAACLIAASEFRIQRGVLIAPFTSTMDMARRMTGLPLGFMVTHRFDNEARLAELAARGPGEVIILHGTDDEVIPVGMSRKLADERKDVVRLTEIPGARHNTIQEENAEEVAAALRMIAD